MRKYIRSKASTFHSSKLIKTIGRQKSYCMSLLSTNKVQRFAFQKTKQENSNNDQIFFFF